MLVSMRTPRYDVPKAAPDPLRLVQVFLNSADVERGSEWLDSEWLVAQGLAAAPAPSSAEVERARTLREALRPAVGPAASAGGALETLDALAARLPLRLRFEPGERPHLEGVEPLARVLAVVAAAQADGTWARLKTCPRCHWAFYDHSRNRSATWCSMSICGNRAKTAAYRRRRGAER